MVGLLLKDYYQTFCIKKNLLDFILGLLLLYGVFFLLPTTYNVILITVLCVPMMGVTPLQYSTERDEISNFDKMLSTFPLSKQQIVLSKLVSTYLFVVFSVAIFSLPMILMAVFVYYIFTPLEGMTLVMMSLLVSYLVLPINDISFMLLGKRKGMFTVIVITIILMIAFITVQFWFGVDQLLRIPVSWWLLGGSVVALILNILGYYICLNIVQRKKGK